MLTFFIITKTIIDLSVLLKQCTPPLLGLVCYICITRKKLLFSWRVVDPPPLKPPIFTSFIYEVPPKCNSKWSLTLSQSKSDTKSLIYCFELDYRGQTPRAILHYFTLFLYFCDLCMYIIVNYLSKFFKIKQ